MLEVLAACGNGMGSSMIIKNKIQSVLKEMNIKCKVHHASIGEARTNAKKYDLILVSQQLVKKFNVGDNTKVIGLVNLLSDDEIREKVTKALKN